MWTGFNAAPGRRLDHGPLVLGREVGLLSPSTVAEALHLHDPALALHRLLADHGPDEDQDDRDPEEDRAEVDGGAEQRSADQQHEDDDGYRHGGEIVGTGRSRRF